MEITKFIFRKNILLILSIFFVSFLNSCGSDSGKDTTTNDKNERKPNTEITNSKQQEFLKKKSDLFFSNVIKPANSALTTMFKEKTENLTKEFLKEINNTLSDWTGTVESVIACDEKGTVIGGDDKTKKILILVVDCGIIKFEENEDNYSLYCEQAQSKKGKTKGLYPNNPVYEKVLNLKEGQKIKFSAKVLISKEQGNYDPVGKDYRNYDEQVTIFQVEFTKLELLPTNEIAE
ncbi:MAG: hypothetical protein WCO13_14625 [Bacteroidota bacterium]